ncbi:MAG: hypothetical protein Q9160_001344 [Pyrenula sp. 1 TL-2023]
MCIAVISTAHPEYSLILVDNRDVRLEDPMEYLNRPTAPATWWPAPHDHVLGGKDLLREIQGTWLGVTKHGRIAVLTNFREEGKPQGVQSRGALINAFLTESPSQLSTDEFVKKLVKSGLTQEVGGFSLVCGKIGEPLAVISNRVSSEESIVWVAKERNQNVGLSNAAYGNRSWRKVVDGERMVEDVIRKNSHAGEDEASLIDGLLRVLSTDTLPRIKADDNLETHINLLRETIFVPAIGRQGVAQKPPSDIAAAKSEEKADILDQQNGQKELGVSGLYGTQKQTVVLVRNSGTVRFFERTLYDQDSQSVPIGEGDVDVSFKLEQ